MKASPFAIALSFLGLLLPWSGFAQPSQESTRNSRHRDERLHVAPAGGIGATARGNIKSGSTHPPRNGGTVKPTNIIPKPRPENARIKPSQDHSQPHLENPGERTRGNNASAGLASHTSSGREPTADRRAVPGSNSPNSGVAVGHQTTYGIPSTMRSTAPGLPDGPGRRAPGLQVLGGINSSRNKNNPGLNGTGMTRRL